MRDETSHALCVDKLGLLPFPLHRHKLTLPWDPNGGCFKDMAKNQSLCDSKLNFLNSTANKKVLGKMKDVNGEHPIAESVGLCLKMYSILGANGKNLHTAKGVKKNVVKNDKRSECHCNYCQDLNKVSLSPSTASAFQQKLQADTVADTLAYGHKDAVCTWAAKMDAYVDEILNRWECHLAATGC